MKTDSKFFRFTFTSPWPLLVFLIIPFLFILSIRFHLQLPLVGSTSSVLYNNAFLSLFVALRVIYYLRGLTRTIRYGADRGIPKASTETARSVSEIKSRLTESGFQFDNAGSYAEKRDLGYLGTALLYAGLLIVFSTGTLDNMRQFSGTFLHGVGMALDLNTNDRYRALATGPFTTAPTTLPKMKIMSHLLPDATYPLGAAEVVFINPTGKEHRVILKAPDPYRAGNFDIYMARMLYEPTISVSIDEQPRCTMAGSC